MRRSTLLISIALMLAVIAVACGTTESKPAADPPTPIPTVVMQADDEGGSTEAVNRASLADPAVQECLADQLGESVDAESGRFGRGFFGSGGSEEFNTALEACGVEPGTAFGGAFGGSGGGRGFGGIAGALTTEVQECLTEQLGEDFASGLTGRFGGRFGGSDDHDDEGQSGGSGLSGSGGGVPNDDFTAALEACGVGSGDGGFGGFGGGLFGGGGRGGLRDGSFQECLTDLLGADALELLRNPTGGGPPELAEAFEQCSGPIPIEPDGGIGDGAGPIPVDPADEPTATPIPVSDLSIEQLTCLSGELDAAALVSVVIATSSGDLSELSDEALVALETCGVES